jgi:hypothetical protein
VKCVVPVEFPVVASLKTSAPEGNRQRPGPNALSFGGVDRMRAAHLINVTEAAIRTVCGKAARDAASVAWL